MDGADTGPITIVIADDHQVIRAALRFFLSQQDGFEVVGEAGDVATTERRVAAFRPRVLILDLNMPGEPTLPAIYGIRQSVPETRIVVLTMETDPASCGSRPRAGPTSRPSSAAGWWTSRRVRRMACQSARSRC